MAHGDGPGGVAGAGDASEGTGQGNAPSGMGGGRNGGNEGGGDRGDTTGTDSGRGLDSVAGKGRRSAAAQAFGAMTDALGSMLGISQQDKTTTLGQKGWKGSGNESRADAGFQDMEAGQSTARGVQVGKTFASMFGLDPAVEAVGDLASKSMTPSAMRSYENTMASRPTAATTAGKIAGRVAGMPGQPVSMVANMVDLGAMQNYTNSLNPDAKTETTQSSSFSGRNPSGSTGLLGSTRNFNPEGGLLTNPNAASLMWEPASYGFGDYGSHIKGLLRS